MNILGIMLNDEILTGGHKRFLELIRGLAARGHRIYLVKGEALQVDIPGVTAFPVADIQDSSMSTAKKIRERIERNLEDLIQACPRLDASLIFGENYIEAAALIKERTGVPIVCAIRSGQRNEFLAMSRPSFSIKGLLKYLHEYWKIAALERRVTSGADLIIFQSRYDESRFLKHNGAASKKTRVIRNNCNASWFDPAYGKSNTQKSVRPLLFIGSFGQRKGILILLEALRLLSRRGIEVSADLVGFGNLEEEVVRFIHDNKLEGSIRIVGRKDDVMPYLKQAGLLVVPSLYDSYPNVVLEALHVGTPVIGTSVGGIPDILNDKELLFRPGSASVLSKKIAEILASPEMYQHVRELCERRREHFVFDWVGEFEKAFLTLPGEAEGPLEGLGMTRR